jgi:hypothetical protein
MKHDNHGETITRLRDVQGTQRDMRQAVREAHYFVDKRDGQWEPEIITRMRGKPRYTDDRTNPIVNQIAGELKQADFSIKIRPAGGDATKQLAEIRNGIIRNIRNMSNADTIFSNAGRKVIKGGYAAWLIAHDYYDADSYDQDLQVEPLHDAHDRVWLDSGDLSDDGSDANWGVILHYITKEDYEDKFDGAFPASIGTGALNSVYYYKPDSITIGHYYYIKEETSSLLLMSDGSVLKASEDVESILDELELKGITVEDSRETKSRVCYFRMFDANKWLGKEERTVFDCIPIVPVYGNFEVAEGKILYRGVVEKMMDMQRVHNYAVSRNVEEVALAPRKKIFMTKEQAEGHEKSISTMNTNMDPVQFYNAQGAVQQPYEIQSNAANSAVLALSESSDQAISRSAGLFAANMGDNTNLQSGIALETQIDRGNNGTSIYFDAMETAIRRTGVILNKAIPLVYDATRQVRLLKEDGTMEMAIMNNVVYDQDTRSDVTLNDLSSGKYDVVCDIGRAYKNRQQEAADMFLKASERDPSLMQVGGDIWLQNVNAVGFDKIAERLRGLAIQNGVIPKEQLTEDELAAIQEQEAEPKEPDVNQIAIEIEQMKAQTAMMVQENAKTQHQIEVAKLQSGQQTDQQKLQSKLAVDSAKIQQTQQRIDQEGARVQLEAQRDQFERVMAGVAAQNEQFATLATALADIKKAIGADVIMSKNAIGAYESVASEINNE